MSRDGVIDPAAPFFEFHEATLSQDGQMLGNRRRRKLQQLGDLAYAQPAAGQGKEGPHAAFVRQGVGNGKHFAHTVHLIYISPDNEMYPTRSLWSSGVPRAPTARGTNEDACLRLKRPSAFSSSHPGDLNASIEQGWTLLLSPSSVDPSSSWVRAGTNRVSWYAALSMIRPVCSKRSRERTEVPDCEIGECGDQEPAES